MALLNYIHVSLARFLGPPRITEASITVSWNVIYSPRLTYFKTLRLIPFQYMHTTEMPPLLYVVILLFNCGLLTTTIKHSHKRPWYWYLTHSKVFPSPFSIKLPTCSYFKWNAIHMAHLHLPLKILLYRNRLMSWGTFSKVS